ncbi:MAG: hypothetical protein DRJ03_15205 [Chloroflexi bacterium]|nr:MAG: hypothetical protein DRJ03_15205 [Chloroflexota bacterium]
MIDEVKYFQEIARSAPPLCGTEFKPFKVTFQMRTPVCVTTPWISFDGLIGHLIMIDTFGQDFFILPRKRNLTPKIARANIKRQIPIKKSGKVYHCSVSLFSPNSIHLTHIYKRFEERWAKNLDRKKIRIGFGHFRAYAMKEVYIPAKEIIFYVNGDMKLIKQLIESYLIGLGNDIRIGFGMIEDVSFEMMEEDWSLVAKGVAMRPIPVSMCKEYDDTAYMPYRGPYWDPRNVTLCVPPGARCRLK